MHILRKQHQGATQRSSSSSCSNGGTSRATAVTSTYSLAVASRASQSGELQHARAELVHSPEYICCLSSVMHEHLQAEPDRKSAGGQTPENPALAGAAAICRSSSTQRQEQQPAHEQGPLNKCCGGNNQRTRSCCKRQLASGTPNNTHPQERLQERYDQRQQQLQRPHHQQQQQQSPTRTVALTCT